MSDILYQKLLLGKKPYFFSVHRPTAFETHRHPEIEIAYCVKGGYDVICEKKRYSLQEGDLIVVGAMASHEIPENSPNSECVTIEFGYSMLGDFFDSFKARNSNCRVYKKSDLSDNTLYKELVSLLEETSYIHSSNVNFCELLIKGNLYKVSAMLLQLLYAEPASNQNKKITDINKIDKALETVYSHYSQPLTVEEVSALCGYSESSFCRVFKNVTGDTFHNILNRHRIEVSCTLLRETNYSVEKIAQETGFLDSKAFCRVFKKYMKMSAGEYRKSIIDG